MQLFLSFLLFSMFVGAKMWDRHIIWRILILGFVCLGVCFAYLTLEQI